MLEGGIASQAAGGPAEAQERIAGESSGRDTPDILGPAAGAFVATADDLQKWTLVAPSGARCIYARAEGLPRGCEGGARAMALADAGMLQINRVRAAPGSSLFHYLARRTAQPLCCDAWRDAAVKAPAPDETLLMILGVLKRCARDRRRCPTNAELRRRVGLETTAQVAWRIRKLVEEGLIRSSVELTGPHAGWRVVTVVSTGKSTLPPPKQSHRSGTSAGTLRRRA